MTAEGPIDYQAMSWDELVNDPVANAELNKAALEYLTTEDRGYLEEHFTEGLDADGYLIPKNPAEQGPVKPHMIVNPKGQDWVLRTAKERLTA